MISTIVITVSLAIYWRCLSRNTFTHTLRRNYASSFSYLYVIGILLYQGIFLPHVIRKSRNRIKLLKRKFYSKIGGHFRPRIPSAMWLATAWCLCGFILSQAYTSTLFTFIISPVRQPLVNSIYDAVANPQIRLLMQKGGLDVMFTVKQLFNYFYLTKSKF